MLHRTARVRTALIGIAMISIAMILFVGCSSSDGQSSGERYGQSEQSAVVEDPTLFLFVSNQSFDEDPVGLTITLDGEQIVGGEFQVKNQHTWIDYQFAPLPGTYDLVATSSTGAEFTTTIEIPVAGPAYALVEYWYVANDVDRQILFRVQDRPFEFD